MSDKDEYDLVAIEYRKHYFPYSVGLLVISAVSRIMSGILEWSSVSNASVFACGYFLAFSMVAYRLRESVKTGIRYNIGEKDENRVG